MADEAGETTQLLMWRVAVASVGSPSGTGTHLRADTNNTTNECANQRAGQPRQQAASSYICLSRCDARLAPSSTATSLAANNVWSSTTLRHWCDLGHDTAVIRAL